jgi:fermentation-respiration switch protein FrsA (DUF1100 family)
VLIVHGDSDHYFPPEHGRELYDGAREPKELWMLPGFEHAERATDDALADRIVAWVASAAASHGAAAEQQNAVLAPEGDPRTPDTAALGAPPSLAHVPRSMELPLIPGGTGRPS